MKRATNSSSVPTASGRGVRHTTESMFSYQRVALSGSHANAATSARGRAISISVTTSTLTGYDRIARLAHHHAAAEGVGIRDPLLRRLARLHGRDREPEAFDAAHEVASQPLRGLRRQRRDDDLAEGAVADGLPHRGERVLPADQALDRPAGG